MTITAKEAGQIARKHGLSLSDAAALAKLADTAQEAHDLAAMFAAGPVNDDPDGLRAALERAISPGSDDLKAQIMRAIEGGQE